MASGVVGGSLQLGRAHGAEPNATGVDCPQQGRDLDRAVHRLFRERPQFSAASPLAHWQTAALFCVAVLAPAALLLIATGRGHGITVLLSVPFAVVVLLRAAAVWQVVMPPRGNFPAPALAAHDLPHYAVLVPVFREVAIAPALVEAMAAIDYPHDKLDIIFITEAADPATRAALAAAAPATHMRIVTVPAGLPQTKPRALNFALQSVSADLVAVFDAEDVPEPQQLRKAAAAFAASDPRLACVQARLSIYNPDDGVLARQFALEYAALFEAILPALERLGLPIMLGGTSNHFRRAALDSIGAWDPYNVTEDADLGVRLARLGYEVRMLDSDTWEEAPAKPAAWLGQRTRWLKGWMQTYLVHMRSPGKLWRALGLWRFYGVQVMLGGMILSALVYPWFYVAAAASFLAEQPVMPQADVLGWLCWFNLACGYIVGITLGLVSAYRSQGRVPVAAALLVPVYWLAISLASYRALWELYARPFHWQKTNHAARPVTPARHQT